MDRIKQLNVFCHEKCEKMLQMEYSANLDQLFRLGASSGGARPKILTQIDGADWHP